MKSRMLIATLLGCLVWQQGALSQTDTIAASPATTNEAAPANQPASTTDTNQSIGTSTANPTTAPAASTTDSSSVTTSNEPAATSAANPPAAPAASSTESSSTTLSSVTNGTSTANPPTIPVASATESPSATNNNETASTANPQPSVPPSIPLIQFQDVPITTAIENLARQAGINYLIDPKIGYGQPDQNGQIKAEPTLSIRWENVTAEQALMALRQLRFATQ